MRENDKNTSVLWDTIILGGGPAGYTAGLYAARAGLKALILEKLSAGGQMALSHQIDNYPGFESGIDGFALAEKMQAQAERFGAVTELAQVLSVELTASPKTVRTSEGTYSGKTVIIATGAGPKALGLPEEHALTGKGVHYCAACDGMFYRGKTVVVVGGGNSAAADALLLSRVAKKVILVHRRDRLRATSVYHGPLMACENVEFCWNSRVTQLLHGQTLTGIRVENLVDGSQREIPCDGLFVSIGRQPETALFAPALTLDSAGYIPAGESTKTEIPGVFAAGDVRAKPLHQIVTAVADGAVAVEMVQQYLSERKEG